MYDNNASFPTIKLLRNCLGRRGLTRVENGTGKGESRFLNGWRPPLAGGREIAFTKHRARCSLRFAVIPTREAFSAAANVITVVHNFLIITIVIPVRDGYD